MNKIFKALAVVVLAGCGTGERDAGRDNAGAKGPSAPLPFELRMRGAAAEGFGSVVLVPNAITILADGVPVKVVRDDAIVNLAKPDHAERIATFELPQNAQRIAFRVELGAAGGFEKPNASGWVDTRDTVLEFDASADWVRRQTRAVVAVDVAKSLIGEDDSTYRMMPKFRVF